MNENYQIISNYYTSLVKKHGVSYKSLDWGSKNSQELRFDIMSQVANLEGKKILDVGCGLADFWSYLQAQKIKVDYTGYDITPIMVEQASTRYPRLKIRCKNLLEEEAEERFDYVFASGIFTFLPNLEQQATMNKLVKIMFGLSKFGIVFNSLSLWADKIEQSEFYADPLKTVDFCRTITSNLVFRHDYLAHDFTIFMYKPR